MSEVYATCPLCGDPFDAPFCNEKRIRLSKKVRGIIQKAQEGYSVSFQPGEKDERRRIFFTREEESSSPKTKNVKEVKKALCRRAGPHACCKAGMESRCGGSERLACTCASLPFERKQALQNATHVFRLAQHEEMLQRQKPADGAAGGAAGGAATSKRKRNFDSA